MTEQPPSTPNAGAPTADDHSAGHALLDGTDRWACKCGEVLHCAAAYREHSNLHRRPEPPPLPTEHGSVERLVAALNDLLTPDGVIQWLTTQAERLEAAGDGAFL